MYNENEISLTEATVLALQGKLKLEETKSTRKRNIKKESVNINTDDVNVSVDDNGDTIVDTDNKTITVSEKVTENPPIEEPTENQETIDVPVNGDETIVPEEEVSEETIDEIVDEPVEDNENIEDLELDESKKVENKNGFSNKVKTEAIEDNKDKELEELRNELWEYLLGDTHRMEDFTDLEMSNEEQTSVAYNTAKNMIGKYSIGELREILNEIASGKIDLVNWGHKVLESKECLKEEEPKYEWVLQGNYGYGWDDLVTYESKEEAQEDYKTYREEEPEFAHRIRKRLIKEENKKESKEVKTEELNFNLSSAVYDELNLYLENIMSKIRDNLNEDTDSNYSEIINKIENSIVDNQLKDKLLDIVKFYSNKDKTTNISDYGSYLAECISSLRGFLKKNINKTEVKEVKTETKYTFNKKSFEEALTKFYNFNDERVKSFKVESIARNKKGSVKIEGKLNNKVPATMVFDKVTEGRTFITYRLNTTNGILKESKEIKTSMTVLKKENTLKCRSLISR